VRRCRLGKAFTLLEMLVVAAMATVVLALAFDLARRADALWARQHDEVEASRTGWQLVHRIARDVRMMLPADAPDAESLFEGTHAASTLRKALAEKDWPEDVARELDHVGIDADTIRFACARVATERGPGRPGLVEYRLHRDPQGNVIGVERRAAPRGTPLARARADVLDYRTRSLGFAYLTPDGRWVREWKAGNGLPRAVRISVAAEGPRLGGRPRLIRFETVVFPPVGTRVTR